MFCRCIYLETISALKMEAVCSAETIEPTCRIFRWCNSEGRHLNHCILVTCLNAAVCKQCSSVRTVYDILYTTFRDGLCCRHQVVINCIISIVDNNHCTLSLEFKKRFEFLSNFTQLVALKPDIDITGAIYRYLVISWGRIRWAVHVAHEESSFGAQRGQENCEIFQTFSGTPRPLV